ncbi:MAG: cupin domain-containing protein [Pseudomonadota bacterium]|nr:cupin domain-containing protein [Pseudomonadota bacterium]
MTDSDFLKRAVAFMHPEDLEQLFVPSSSREFQALVPNYALDEEGVDRVKVLMATPNLIVFEAFRLSGAIDRLHMHADHHSIAYQKSGRVRMTIGSATYLVETGDTYQHPMGVSHRHEALENSVRIEIKFYPDGNAIQSWNTLTGAAELTP